MVAGVRREVTFRSSAFNTTEHRDYFINEGCFGDDLAKWLMTRLREGGVETDPEPGQEDFGWYFNFTVPAGTHCCVIGYQPDEPHGVWHLWLERSRGFVASIFGRRNHGIDEEAVNAIDRALRSSSEVSEINWES